jgi:hypothetical protein
VGQNSDVQGGKAEGETMDMPGDHLHELRRFTDLSWAHG